MEETNVKREFKKGRGKGKQGFKKKSQEKIFNKTKHPMLMIFLVVQVSA